MGCVGDAQRADDAMIDLHHGVGGLDDQAGRCRLQRGAVRRQGETRDERAMNEPQALQPLMTRGLDHVQRTAADDQPAQRQLGRVLARDCQLGGECDGRSGAIGGAPLHPRGSKRVDLEGFEVVTAVADLDRTAARHGIQRRLVLGLRRGHALDRLQRCIDRILPVVLPAAHICAQRVVIGHGRRTEQAPPRKRSGRARGRSPRCPPQAYAPSPGRDRTGHTPPTCRRSRRRCRCSCPVRSRPAGWAAAANPEPKRGG